MKKPWEYQWDNLSDMDMKEMLTDIRKNPWKYTYSREASKNKFLYYTLCVKKLSQSEIIDILFNYCCDMSSLAHCNMKEHQMRMKTGEIKPALKRIDMDELEKLKQDGWKIKDLATKYGVSERTIRNRLNNPEYYRMIQSDV